MMVMPNTFLQNSRRNRPHFDTQINKIYQSSPLMFSS